MSPLTFLTEPFALGFMRRALAGCLALSLAAPPLGVVARAAPNEPDERSAPATASCPASQSAPPLPASPSGAWAWAAFWPASQSRSSPAASPARPAEKRTANSQRPTLSPLALGVAIVSQSHGIDLQHLLFGSVLAVDNAALLLMAGVATIALPGLAVIWTMSSDAIFQQTEITSGSHEMTGARRFGAARLFELGGEEQLLFAVRRPLVLAVGHVLGELQSHYHHERVFESSVAQECLSQRLACGCSG